MSISTSLTDNIILLLSISLDIDPKVKITEISHKINLLTFHQEALKQLRVVERTPEPDECRAFDGLTVNERRDVEELARKLKVNNPTHLICDDY